MRRALALLFALVGSLGATDTPAPAASSGWVFELLPKSLQKNPRLDVTILTEMTDAGRRLPQVDRAHPAYYVLQAGGYHARHQDVTGEKKLPPAELETIVQRALASAGYLPAAPEQGHPPSLVLIYTWGVHGEPLASDTMTPAALDRNLRERAALVGGEKFAARLLDLIRRNRELMDAQTSGLRLDVGTDQPAPPPVGAELFAFMNPVERFRQESPKNAFLLEQIRGDINFVVLSAYSVADLAAGQRTLLWRTRMTAGADGVTQLETLPALVRTGAAYFGRDMTEVATVNPRAHGEARTELGPIELVGYEENRPANPPAPPVKP
jgi:hypothetical protein